MGAAKGDLLSRFSSWELPHPKPDPLTFLGTRPPGL